MPHLCPGSPIARSPDLIRLAEITAAPVGRSCFSPVQHPENTGILALGWTVEKIQAKRIVSLNGCSRNKTHGPDHARATFANRRRSGKKSR